MTAAFQQLAAQICAYQGAPVPDLTADADGVFAFSTSLHGVKLALSHDPLEHPEQVLVHVVFGQLPARGETAALRDLLTTNFELRMPQAPSFGLNPETGDVVLRYAHAFAAASVEELWATLQSLVDAALDWREDSARQWLNDTRLEDSSDAWSPFASRLAA